MAGYTFQPQDLLVKHVEISTIGQTTSSTKRKAIDKYSGGSPIADGGSISSDIKVVAISESKIGTVIKFDLGPIYI